MCHQKDPTFYRSLSLKDPHFYQLSPNDPQFLTNSLSSKDPDTSLSLKDPSFSHSTVKQVTIFGKKNWFFKNFDKFDEKLRNFWPFWPWKTPFFRYFTKRPPIFEHFVTERPPFLTQFVTESLTLHLSCLVALVRHFHMWVPPPGGAMRRAEKVLSCRAESPYPLSRSVPPRHCKLKRRLRHLFREPKCAES